MKVIDTSVSKPSDLTEFEREMVYNGLDCCVTAEVLEALLPQLDNHTAATYNFSRELQAPVLEMRLRGCLIDAARKAEVIDEFFAKIEILEGQLERIVLDGVGLPSFNWRSTKDLQRLFYDELGVPPPRGKRSVNRDQLEKMEAYLIARPIVKHLTTMRELQKKIDVLKQEIDPDGRIRTSYNIAGTSTGRFSSSISEFGTGGNLQNVEEALRSIFISDPGYKFAKFDGAQIQSRIVGAIEWNLFDDSAYLDACESGDLHTTVAKMTWTELKWTGDLHLDKELAEKPFYRHYSRRFMCKKLGHGSNFDGQPPTLSTQTKIPLLAVEEFYRKYHKTFPAHHRWRDWTAEQLRKTGTIIALDGRKRMFWGRRTDPQLVRDALAYDAQSTESFIMGTGMLNVWRARTAILMFHDHDAITVQYPEEQEAEIIPQILEKLKVPIQLKNGRTLLIPFDCRVGWNKGEASGDNIDGLIEWKGSDKRRRSETRGILDRPILRKHP